MTEEELQLVQDLIDDIEYLKNYANRVATGQVDRQDPVVLKRIRTHVEKAKKVFVCL